MKQLISDDIKFKQLKQNPTKSREDGLSAYLRKLRTDELIDNVTFNKILPSGSSPGVLYGLSKVHKAGCPFRPIVSSINTYNYNLPTYLLTIIPDALFPQPYLYTIPRPKPQTYPKP